MPKVPKWMANAMESLFSGSYHPVTVTAVDDVAEHLRKIRFEGDFSKSKRIFYAGNVVEFRISDTEFRHYTPSFFNMDEGICEVLFYLHDKGPGSKWVSLLKVGDELKLLGPGGKIKYNPNNHTHFCFGDETSLGAFLCIKKETEKCGHHFFGITELDEANKNWPEILDLNIDVVPKNHPSEAVNVLKKLEAILQKQKIDKEQTTFYLTGNAKSISMLKRFLLEKGFSNKQIQTEPYWAEGKTGL